MEHQADEVDSRPLPESFAPDGHAVVDALDAYYRESVGGRQPVIHQERLARNIEQLDLATLVREGGLAGPRLETFVRDYLAATTRLHHPAFLAHQVAAPHPTGSLASLIDGFTNNAMAIYEMGPGAASIEFFVINWMLEKIGWQPAPVEGDATAPAVPRDGRAAHAADDPPIGGGVLTHGGSLANLTALLAARRQIAPDSWRTGTPNDLVLFAPAVSHYSIARAAGILGLGQDAVWPLEVDDRGATIAERLPAVLGAARAAGKRPLAVVANSCNTPVGAYDPLLPIGEFCRRHGIWLHVDGAHGASALVSPTHRHLLDGIELADSLTWDAHKMLRAPTLCAALLVRDHRTIDAAFQQEASYLFHEKEQPGVDFAQRTVECTKAGLGLKVFMVLAALGERGLAAYIDHEYALSQQAYEYLVGQSDVKCAARPEGNILCFRVAGSDTKQLRIRDALNEEGSFYLSSTVFREQRYLRMVVINPETSLADIERCVERVREIAGGIRD